MSGMEGQGRTASDHFDGRRFFTPDAPPVATLGMVLRWQFFSHRKKAVWPSSVPVLESKPESRPGAVTATWINHSTFLLQTPAGNFLTDPVYSRRAGPLGLVGPRRVHAPGVPFDALPGITAVLLSHDHYDHCDMAALRRLARRDAPVAITPLGNGALLRSAGFTRIVELDWWGQTREVPGVDIAVTPAQHWSNRLSGLRCRRLWGGFFLTLSGLRIYFAGDSGYHPRIFRQIRENLGAPDLALLPIGAYEPRWFMRPQHCDPAEAVQIHLDVGARRSVAMHWGCFQLTDEAREEPPRALGRALADAGLAPESFVAVAPGESVAVGG
ncbi:MAG: MBL fold metallo-hydrolase [Puniceicoccales bacterium]|jgi:L-ascorbate metabolism protein UlaG (beta-lactamase superfamily)|nr:MBL fold metallo-hydrolase [Puniceicoccales bacterium]